MKMLRNTVIRAGLEALYFSGAHYLLRPIFAGVGAIFMLHLVRPRRDAEFPTVPTVAAGYFLFPAFAFPGFSERDPVDFLTDGPSMEAGPASPSLQDPRDP